MQQLIDRLATETGLDAAKIESALGVFLGLVKSQGNPNTVSEFFAKLPGAESLVAAQGSTLMSKLAGGMMGGPLAAITKLQALGLSPDHMKLIGSGLLTHARAAAGDDLVRRTAANIPGVSGFL